MRWFVLQCISTIVCYSICKCKEVKMVFSSLFFVCVFLVACYGVYYISKGFGASIKAQNIILLVSSLIFYAWGGPPLVLLLCLMTFVCWIGALIIASMKHKTQRRITLITVVTICLAILFIFKYTNFFLYNMDGLFGYLTAMLHLPKITLDVVLPIGISFYTFQLISYVVDVYRREAQVQKKYWLLLLYASLFHQCIAGPIVRYSDVQHEIENRVMTLEDTTKGVSRFAVGLAKKAILANGCALLADSLAPFTTDKLAQAPTIGVWLGLLFYMLQIYLDFSAYSDMAIGMALMVGFHYRENFNYPYCAHSVTDFWRRWHISLSSFFRDYVYIPLGGNRVSVPRHILNMLVVWALTGFWHGASWNYLLWGLYYFIFLVIEKFVLKINMKPHGIMRFFRIIPTMIIVYFGWLIFRYEDFGVLGSAFYRMLGISLTVNGEVVQGVFSNATVTSLFTNNIFFLCFCILSCLPVLPALEKLAKKNALTEKIYAIASVPAPAVLIILSACALAGNTYNPFLYFQF